MRFPLRADRSFVETFWQRQRSEIGRTHFDRVSNIDFVPLAFPVPELNDFGSCTGLIPESVVSGNSPRLSAVIFRSFFGSDNPQFSWVPDPITCTPGKSNPTLNISSSLNNRPFQILNHLQLPHLFLQLRTLYLLEILQNALRFLLDPTRTSYPLLCHQ